MALVRDQHSWNDVAPIASVGNLSEKTTRETQLLTMG